MREPGSVQKFKPGEYVASASPADAVPAKVFLDNETEVLERLYNGELMFILIKNPSAIWLAKPNVTAGFNPNVTIGVYKRFRNLGYIDHLRDEFPHGIWSISKHGEKAFETMKRKAEAPSLLAQVLTEKKEQIDKVIEKTHDFETKSQPSVGEQLKDHLPTQAANVLRLSSGAYILAVELPDYLAVVKAAAMLHVDLPHAEKAAPKERVLEAKTAVCDYCHESYQLKMLKLKIWKRYCTKPQCKRDYFSEYMLFKNVYGRSPKFEDRDVK